MLKKLSFLIILLLTVCLTGCGNTIMPEKTVQDFEDSVSFDEETGILSFTIPNGLASKYSFYIHVSGRVKMGDGAMSIHLFEDESENNSWESGKTYSHEFGKDELIEAIIVAGIQEQGKSEVIYETQIDIKSEPDEIITDSISYPIENADPSIGAFGNDLLHTYNDELVILLNQWLDAHRNGTFKEIQNHHPAYPSDFPSANQLPVIGNVDDVIIAWRESVMLDANTELGGGVFIVVPIDQSHLYILEPAKFSDADNNITIGFANSGFMATSIEDFIAQSEIDFWFGNPSFEFSDPNNTIVEQRTERQNSNIPTPDSSAPLGSAENPKTFDMTDTADFVKDEEYGLYSKIVSCSIENDVMTVIFSAYAENPVNVEVLMDAWLSDDNGAGQVIETYCIDKLKEYSVSMPSSWFNENDARGRLYMVNVYIVTPTSTVTTHSFHYRDGKMS